MNPENWADTPEFREWAEHVLDDLVPMIDGSAVTCSLVPNGPTDVKFAVELGLSIMLDKPIMLIVLPGTKVPAHLARCADDILEASQVDKRLARRIQSALKRLAP